MRTQSLMSLLSGDGFMPHGMCYLWQPGVLLLHVVSDALITLAYLSIPFTLLYFIRRRPDLGFPAIFAWFAAFIVACGISHLMDIVTIWEPVYWISGAVKAITALASVPTAILLARLVPTALKVPSPAALQAANLGLEREVRERKRIEQEVRQINGSLEERVARRTEELQAANGELLREIEVRRQSEERLAQALNERETLLQEVHHRVKNNMQVLSSLIRMQMRLIADPATRAALKQCGERVETMAQIHEMLYQSKDYARVPFGKYARNLALRIFSASGLPDGPFRVHFDVADCPLPLETSIPCGLILNELIANSLRHGFSGRTRGDIRVVFRALPNGRYELAVCDDGIGFAPGEDPTKSKSLGMHLIQTLVEQLRGTLQLNGQRGASFRIEFSLEPKT